MGAPAQDLGYRRDPQGVPGGGAGVSAPVRGGLVHGHSVGRLRVGQVLEAGRAHVLRQVRGVHHAARPQADARAALRGFAVAVRRGPADGRGDASAGHPGHAALRQAGAQPGRGAHPLGGALEVRVQEHQIHRAHSAGAGGAEEHLAGGVAQ